MFCLRNINRGIAVKASSFPVAVFFVIAGMAWGSAVTISNAHAAMPAHAHLNLLGWVSLFLFGIFYFLQKRELRCEG
jgi:hypothetical protein